MSSQQVHDVVIVGGNFAGVDLSHYLLRKTFPALNKVQPEPSYRVTLISPNTHYYFKVAAPRALISPDLIPEEKYFKSIDEAFNQYDVAVFNHVCGKATSLDSQARTISVQLSADSTQQTVKYDSLVIASGTTSSPLWTIVDTHEKSRAALKELHEALPKASTVLIAGAGPVGVETAGEVASAYPKAKITLVTASDRLLSKQGPSLGVKAKGQLEKLGVVVRTNTRLSEPGATTGERTIKFSDGSSETPDVFIDATGASKNNTEWVPSEWLDTDRRVATRDAYFRVKGNEADVKRVYVIGDVVSGAKQSAIELDAMVPCVASSIAVDILGATTTSNAGFLSSINPFAKPSLTEQQPFKAMDAIVIPIGPGGGVGQVMGINMLSFMVKKGKSERFLMELVEPAITGKKYA